MEHATYVTLARQSGLVRELQAVANNIANMGTTGFRSEGVIFSEFVRRTGGDESLSMAAANVRATSTLPGETAPTGAPFDFAIEGEGFFLVETAAGERLTRAGSFTPNAAGELVTPDGHRLLDAGGAPVFVPPDAAGVALVDPLGLRREDGVLFRAEGGTEPGAPGRILQGYLEASNVDPIGEVARMVAVQRAYEMGQSFLDAENERLRTALRTFVK
ncbi:flagellar hook-basal body complex protein [Rhodosalinus sp.]|uniref:flagellar hook-basal body complex protein n=1 Tax=Rhodosalinus sp. TaxID=2047741 RepID=UPI0039782A9B